MKILLLSGYISRNEMMGDYAIGGPYAAPYGLLCLSSVLEKNGFKEIKILNTELDKNFNKNIIDEIKKFSPKIIGITVYSVAIKHVVKVFKYIKYNFKDIILVAGGPHITTTNYEELEYLIEENIFDYCCIGEGEYTFLELVKAISTNSDVGNIKGLVYKNNKGKIVKNSSRPLIENLDELPFPSFHLLKNELKNFYPQPMIYRKRPVIMLITSRGCMYDCKFCSSKSLWNAC